MAARVSGDAPVKGRSMTKGTAKFYNEQKGYGFIQPDDGGKDVLVRATALERAGIPGLHEGQKGSFDTQTDLRSGKTAVGARRGLEVGRGQA